MAPSATVTTMIHRFFALLLIALAAGCNTEPAPSGETAAADKPAVRPDRSPGKPSAPIEFRYQVLGTPRVGQPVAIEIELVSPVEQPLTMRYAIPDADALSFAAEQPQAIELSVEQGRAARQVTVVPQREGRLYLNVTAELDTGSGSQLKSIAIPLSVGRADVEPEVNGELKEGPEGETVVSMPAEEN